MKLIASSSYLPKRVIDNKKLAHDLGIDENFIEKRTGIKQRYFVADETLEEMVLKATQGLINKAKINLQEIDLIIVATTSTNRLMPGISNYVQKKFKISKCICFDILAGCGGYVNAVDITKMYMDSGKVKKAIVIGADILSEFTDATNIGTAIILGDGAGATLYENSSNEYFSNIEAVPDSKNILTCTIDSKINMDGLAVYKYAVTETVKNIRKLLEENNLRLEEIKYIIPHQSNLKIMLAIAERLGINREKVFTNIDKIGNTFCASIPIALEEMQDKKLIKTGDKIILLGYGAGLNTASIYMQI